MKHEKVFRFLWSFLCASCDKHQQGHPKTKVSPEIPFTTLSFGGMRQKTRCQCCSRAKHEGSSGKWKMNENLQLECFCSLHYLGVGESCERKSAFSEFS